MKTLLNAKPGWALATFLLLDTLCDGLGMAVPIFCIGFGLVVGWYLARRFTAAGLDLAQILGRLLSYATLTAAVTLLLMAVIWGPKVAMLNGPDTILANFGIPQILYSPRASFVGWLVLMILISPFLQLLTTVLGAHVTLVWLQRSRA